MYTVGLSPLPVAFVFALRVLVRRWIGQAGVGEEGGRTGHRSDKDQKGGGRERGRKYYTIYIPLPFPSLPRSVRPSQSERDVTSLYGSVSPLSGSPPLSQSVRPSVRPIPLPSEKRDRGREREFRNTEGGGQCRLRRGIGKGEGEALQQPAKTHKADVLLACLLLHSIPAPPSLPVWKGERREEELGVLSRTSYPIRVVEASGMVVCVYRSSSSSPFSFKP